MILVLLWTGICFAESNSFVASTVTYTIEKVTGTVTVETPVGAVNLYEGQTVKGNEIVKVSLNSSIVLQAADGKKFAIKSLKRGMVYDIVEPYKAITIGAKAKESTVTAEPVQARTNVSTASTRASDATKDLEWSE